VAGMNSNKEGYVKTILRSWKPILLWGMVLVAVLMLGAVIDNTGISGTCMFILMPYFAAMAATIPVIKVKRFGTGICTFLPYVLIGFYPLYYFDWVQRPALIGLWAVFAYALSGFVIGAVMDLAYLATGRLPERTRAIVVGAAMQAITFVVTLVGLGCLYTPTSDMAAHVHFFDRGWFFSLPWMVVNGAFGGYTACALKKQA